MLRRFDSHDPADDLRHDEATHSAWQHISSEGLNTPLPSNIEENNLFQQNISIIRADLASDARTSIVIRDFHALTGRGDITSMEVITMMNLLIDGKAAAWKRHNIITPLANIADEMSANNSGLMGTEIAKLHITAPSTAQPISLPETSHCEMPARNHTLFAGACTNTTTPAIVDNSPFDATISAVVQRMNESKRSEKIEEKTLRQYESFAISGISDLLLLRQHHVTAFRADLARLPKSWGKSPNDCTATRDQIMVHAASLPPDKVGLSVGTVNRHLEHLGQIVEWALDEGISLDHRLKPTKLMRKDNVRDRDKKEAFNETQLSHLFKTPVWKGSKSERYQALPGSTVYRNGVF